MTLKELRKSRQLTQEAVALRAGMRPSRVGSIERGKLPNLKLDTIKRLAQAMECSVPDVIDALDETVAA